MGSYRVFFWSNENNEPIHVHVCKGKPSSNATKIWLTTQGGCIVANNNSKIPASDLNKLLVIIAAQHSLIFDAWKAHFVLTDIKFYC